MEFQQLSALIEDVRDGNEAMNWSEFRRMFSNIGWKGTIPDTLEQCESNEKTLYQLCSLMHTLKIKPSTIRNKKAFMNEMEKEFYKDYKQYVDRNLNENRQNVNEQNENRNWCNGFANIFGGLCSF